MSEPHEQTFADEITEMNELKRLIAQPGWKRFVDTMQEQADLRSAQIILVPAGKREMVDGMGNVLLQEFEKGECAGINTTLKYPELRIKAISDVIEMTSKDETNVEN